MQNNIISLLFHLLKPFELLLIFCYDFNVYKSTVLQMNLLRILISILLCIYINMGLLANTLFQVQVYIFSIITFQVKVYIYRYIFLYQLHCLSVSPTVCQALHFFTWCVLCTHIHACTYLFVYLCVCVSNKYEATIYFKTVI